MKIYILNCYLLIVSRITEKIYEQIPHQVILILITLEHVEHVKRQVTTQTKTDVIETRLEQKTSVTVTNWNSNKFDTTRYL